MPQLVSVGKLMNRRGAAAAVAPTPVTAGLFLEYRMDEGSGLTVLGYDSGGLNAAKNASFYTADASYTPTWGGGGVVSALNSGHGKIMTNSVDMSTVRTLIVACDLAPPVFQAGQTGIDVFSIGQDVGYTVSIRGDGSVATTTRNAGLGAGDTIGVKRKNGPSVLAITFDGTAQQCFIDGVEVPAYLAQNLGVSPSGTGYFGWSTGINYIGHWYWLNAYTTKLSSAEIAQQSTYIQAQVALRGVSFADTLAASAPQIIVLGDSLAYGFGVEAGAQYITQAAQSLSMPTRYYNLGLTGYSTTEAQTALTAALLALPGPTIRIVILGYLVNDILAGRSAATILANLAAIAATVKGQGATKVIANTGSDVDSFTAGEDAVKADVNAGIVAGLTNVDFVCDIGASAELGAAGASLNTTYFQADKVHWKAAGDTVAAALEKTQINNCGVS